MMVIISSTDFGCVIVEKQISLREKVESDFSLEGRKEMYLGGGEEGNLHVEK